MSDLPLELYKKAFRNTENPTVITDEDYVIRDVNQACIEFTGYERAELVGNLPLMLFSKPETFEQLLSNLEKNEPWQGYFEAETKDGFPIYGQGSATPLHIDGEVRGYSGIFVNLTERRRYEQALQVIHRVLRHDLKNEMNLVLGYLETLEADSGGDTLEPVEEVTGIVDGLLRRAERARRFEEQLYDGFERPNRTVDLESVLEAEIDRFSRRFPEVQVVVDSLPDREVIADDLLEAVFESLLENTVTHSDGVPTVEVTAEEHEECVTVSVADDGPGVPEENREQIFGREEVDSVQHGEGFSLYFVDSVVDMYGGAIDVSESDLGGASFDLRLLKA